MKQQHLYILVLVATGAAFFLMAMDCVNSDDDDGFTFDLDDLTPNTSFTRSVEDAGITCCEDETLPFVVGTVTIKNTDKDKKGWFEFETGDATLEANPASGDIPAGGEVTIQITVKQCGWEFAFLDYSWGFQDDSGAHVGENDSATLNVTNSCYIVAQAISRLQINPLDDLALKDAIAFSPIGVEVLHSADAIAAMIPFLPFTDTAWRVAFRNYLVAQIMQTLYGNTDYPCGVGDYGYTVCPNIEEPLAEGDWLFAFNILIGDVPIDDSEHYFQYGFVFDSDGNPDNNYQGAPPYSNDFYDDTDLWYSVEYDPAGGWHLAVTDASGGGFTEIASAARATIMGNTIMLAVPMSEFAVDDPRYRVTAFAHKGDYGMGADEYWSGDNEPKVADGLDQVTVDLTP